MAKGAFPGPDERARTRSPHRFCSVGNKSSGSLSFRGLARGKRTGRWGGRRLVRSDAKDGGGFRTEQDRAGERRVGRIWGEGVSVGSRMIVRGYHLGALGRAGGQGPSWWGSGHSHRRVGAWPGCQTAGPDTGASEPLRASCSASGAQCGSGVRVVGEGILQGEAGWDRDCLRQVWAEATGGGAHTGRLGSLMPTRESWEKRWCGVVSRASSLSWARARRQGTPGGVVGQPPSQGAGWRLREGRLRTEDGGVCA